MALGVLAGHLPGFAQTPKQASPASKLYVSDVSGQASIHTGDLIEDLAKRAVYAAQGTVIETKRPTSETDREKHFSTMVFSNGTGAFFDADTRVEVRRFVQEPFTPNRTDLEVEPSISQTQVYISRGVVGLCVGKLVAGSSMVYLTPHGSINIRGRKLVIEVRENFTKVSMLEGESTVRAGATDPGGRNVQTREQAIISRREPGQPLALQTIQIPDPEMPALDEKVTLACMARRTVYFDVQDSVNAFSGSPTAPGEIVPLEVVPGRPPVEFTVSPASLVTPGQTVTPGRP